MPTLRPYSDVDTLLDEAQHIYKTHAATIHAEAHDSESARMLARKLVADLSIRSAEPLGVELMTKVPMRSTTDILFGAAPAMKGGENNEEARNDNFPMLDEEEGQASKPKLVHSDDPLAATVSLRTPGPPSTLSQCPYCTEPYRRFCPESGRRHETQDEKAQRQWRTIFRQLQFASKMANLSRLEKPNTCAEEFYIEL